MIGQTILEKLTVFALSMGKYKTYKLLGNRNTGADQQWHTLCSLWRAMNRRNQIRISRTLKMKRMIQLTIMVIFLVRGMAASDAGHHPGLMQPKDGNLRTYSGLETTPTPVSIGTIARRISADPRGGLEIPSEVSSPIELLGPNGQPLPFRSRQEVEEFLRTAKIVSQKRIEEGINRPLKVLLEKDGIQMYATFRDVRSGLPWKRRGVTFRDDAIFECAAYELSKLLGLDNVPPTVERKIGRKKGTLQAWIENAMTDKALRNKGIQPPSGEMDKWRWKMQWQVVHIFDNLIYNEDRNRGNIMIEPSWRLWMIDHTRAFRRWKELRNPQDIRYCERSLWEKLQTLDETEVRERLKDFVTRSEMEGLLERVGLLVEHINKLIAEHGERDVLFTFR